MYKIDNFLVTSSSSWKDHIGVYLPQSSQDPDIALVKPRFNMNSSQSQRWLTFSREVQFFSPLERNTAHVRIYKHIEAKINKYKTNHFWYVLPQNATARRWPATPRSLSFRIWRCKDYLVNNLLVQMLIGRVTHLVSTAICLKLNFIVIMWEVLFTPSSRHIMIFLQTKRMARVAARCRPGGKRHWTGYGIIEN
jgi:hypothetical protein